MLDILLQLLFAGAVVAVIYNWDEIANTIANWLRRHNLEKSWLMKILICFDRTSSGVKYRLTAKGRNYEERQIETKTMSEEQLQKEDPEVYEIFKQRGYAVKDVTNKVLHNIY